MVHKGIDGINPKILLPIQPNIGLDTGSRQFVVAILNICLANEAVLAMKTRGAYWNVCGTNFLELHTLFDGQYKQLNNAAGEIAQRTRMLGGFAIASLEEILNQTRLEEQPGEIPGILNLLADHEATIRFIRQDARKCTEEYEDDSTFELLVNVMHMHEKMAWMLRSLIEPGPGSL
jgi:starvation-inducible DNA-binding protein